MECNGVIQRKFALLDKHLLHLQSEFKDVDFESFKSDWVIQRMTERVLQVMIEIVVDIAERIIALNSAGPAATAVEAMEKLVELGVIKSAQDYTDMVRFRNLIVHQYEEIDPAILFGIVNKKLDTFRQFRKEVDNI
ncbi:MAG: DUF86 domain-containing protein [Planctomycetes bacterium]|nr:DUF86 domain-containing protein [Planctomycetota bacterium]